MDDVRIELWAQSPSLAAAWRDAFAGVRQVSVRVGDILDGEADALVSPANSFGYMDGGLDLQISLTLGWQVEDRVRADLRERWDGELPVGCAVIVPTDHGRFPWLISAPTMRIPMRVDGTVNAFLAFRAILYAVRRHPTPIRTIRCPGLGTGAGQMSRDACARQMRRAWAEVVEGRTILGGLAGRATDHLEMIGREV